MLVNVAELEAPAFRPPSTGASSHVIRLAAFTGRGGHRSGGKVVDDTNLSRLVIDLDTIELRL